MGRKHHDDEVAAAAARREVHVRLHTARAGDPNYTQHVRDRDGNLTVHLTELAASVMEEGVSDLVARFEEKFGRPPGPDDPLFFDPDEDEPVQLSLEKMKAEMSEAAHALIESAPEEGRRLRRCHHHRWPLRRRCLHRRWSQGRFPARRRNQ